MPKKKPKRIRWPRPSKKSISKFLVETDASELRYGREKRVAFLFREFGDPYNLSLWLTGGIAPAFAISEIINSFVNANYLATILLCQIFAEHQLAGPYSLAGNKEVVGKGFKFLIDQSVADKRVGAEAAKGLHELRMMRNAYTHHRLIDDPHGLVQRAYQRGMNKRLGGADPYKMAEKDARLAIEIVVDTIRDNSPHFKPSPKRKMGKRNPN